MTWDEAVSKFLSKVYEIKAEKPSYKQPGDGSDGTCDCIGLIIGALRRMGLKWTGIHGSNWAARKEISDLAPIKSVSDLSLGDAVLKAAEKGTSKWKLPDRYKVNGKYYNGDLKDYYHVGVVTSVNPLNITHMTSPTVKVDTSLGSWNYHGTLDILKKAAGETVTKKETTTTKTEKTEEQIPAVGSKAVVVASNGKPVKMRQYPDKKCRTWDELDVGTIVEILEPGETWAKINGGRRKGWYMMADYLDIIGDGKGQY